ncbi:MAG: hypothetical protein CMO66_07685 [Verrucomicrobiales bacterium]|nr:hypothetical protein [Verrucomicrobiales bacterium]|tara:strand:- start:71 stop:499 length:429 start_codon:yes stop_codon:yes gene_type:complete
MRLKKTILQAGLLAAFCLTGCYATQSGESNYTLNVFSDDKLVRRYDRPVDVVLPAVRKTLADAGVITAEDATTNVISARVNTRYVWVKVESDTESDNISRVTYQVRTKSSWVVAGRNPDVRMAAELAEGTFQNLVVQENPQP